MELTLGKMNPKPDVLMSFFFCSYFTKLDHVGLTGTLRAWLVDTHAKINVVLSYVVYVQKPDLFTLEMKGKYT